MNHIYHTFERGRMREVIRIAEGSVGCANIAQGLTKNVELACYALSRIEVPCYFFLQPTLMVTGKPSTKHDKKGFSASEKPVFLDCYREIDNSLSKLTYEAFTYVDLSSIFDEEKKDILIDSEALSCVPAPRLIIVFRDTAASAERVTLLTDYDYITALRDLLDLHNRASALLDLYPEPVAVVSYEKVLVRPDRFIDQLAEFLGVCPDAAQSDEASAFISPERGHADPDNVGWPRKTTF